MIPFHHQCDEDIQQVPLNALLIKLACLRQVQGLSGASKGHEHELVQYGIFLQVFWDSILKPLRLQPCSREQPTLVPVGTVAKDRGNSFAWRK